MAPAVHLRPQSEEEIAAAFQEARERGLRVLPSGSGTKMAWRFEPDPEGSGILYLSTRSLTKIVDFDPGNLTVTAQAGLTWQALQRRLADKEQWLPLDSPWGEEATVGGIVAAGVAGPRAFGYGEPRDVVLGVKAVLPSGAVVRFGGKTVKNVAGYDVTKLFVGSFGTLGVLTEVTFRLRPVPPQERTVLISFSDWGDADGAVARILTLPQPVVCLEAVNAPLLRQLDWGIAPPSGNVRCMLAVRLEARPIVLESAVDKLLAALDQSGLRQTSAVLSDVDSRRFWKFYEQQLYRDWGADETILRLTCKVADAVKVLGQLSESLSEPAWFGAGSGSGFVRIQRILNPEEIPQLLLRLRASLGRFGVRVDLIRGPREGVREVLRSGQPLWHIERAGVHRMGLLRRIFDPEMLLAPFLPFGGIDGPY